MKKIKPTNLDKTFWPKEGYTKGDVIKYYEKISATILPYLKDRPENLNRNPNGIADRGFFQKDINFEVPRFVTIEKIYSESNKENLNYLICQNKQTLAYMANLGCIEVNPWNSRIDNLDKPDYMIIDIDPGKKSFDDAITVAQETKKVLDMICEESFVKTSGKTGLHVCIPLGGRYTYEQIKPLAHIIAKLVNHRLPEITSLERTPIKRKGKIYLDYLQNSKGQTLASAYSLRPFPGATVSAPLEWDEVKAGLTPQKFTIKTIFKRLKQKGDLWKPLLSHHIDLQTSLKCLEDHFDIEKAKEK